jgi:hypothetical protein
VGHGLHISREYFSLILIHSFDWFVACLLACLHNGSLLDLYGFFDAAHASFSSSSAQFIPSLQSTIQPAIHPSIHPSSHNQTDSQVTNSTVWMLTDLFQETEQQDY